MTSPTVDRRFGLVGNAAIKAPVAAVATSNITLSGQQTIDGVAVLAVNASSVADRVLCVGQTDSTQNGLYDVSLNAWSRSADGDGPYDFAQGSMVFVNGGTTNVGTAWYLATTGPITVGTTALTWHLGVGVNLLTAVQAAQASAAQANAIVQGNFLQAGTGGRARTFTSKDRDFVSVMDFGATADGTLHALSSRYASLAAAQVDYPFATSLNQSIDWAAFMAAIIAAGHGGRVIVPNALYYLTDTVKVYKQVTIIGAHEGEYLIQNATRIIAAQDIDAFWFQSGFDTGNNDRADGSRISSLQIYCETKHTSGRGIYASTHIKIDNLYVQNFKGVGIEIYGNTGGPSIGIADSWEAHNVVVNSCGGHGFWNHGNDAQVGTAINVQCLNNGGWGFRDEASYGSVYTSCQSSGNTSGAFYNNPGATFFGSIYIGCYAEGFALSNLNGQGLIIGGVMHWQDDAAFMPSVTPGGMAINLPASGALFFMRSGVQVGIIDNDNILKNFGAIWIRKVGSPNDYVQHTENKTDYSTTTAAGQDRLTFSVFGTGFVGKIITSSGGTSYTTISDHRLKDDVLPMQGALAKVMALKPCTYKWKSDGSSGQGFIAHELQAIVPECVSGEKDAMREVDVVEHVPEDVLDKQGVKVGERLVEKIVGKQTVPDYQGLDASFLVATLTAALQELSAKLDAYVAAHP